MITPFEKAFSEVKGLVKQFEANKDHYRSSKYQESQVRKDYIDKFWKALGWDVDHITQTNPREQEVHIEFNSDSISNRKVDYAFFLAPEYQRPAFLVEAKKPSVGLEDKNYYFQTVRYGYNRSTTISILTDFQEFHILDCRRKPEKSEHIIKYAKIKKYSYTDFLDQNTFGDFYWYFSREAVEQGKLKAFWKSLPKAKGAAKQLKLIGDDIQQAPPDDDFLADLDGYREELAKAFKKTNFDLSGEVLTASVQAVLDRLVFIRFLEDKLIEPDFIVDKFLDLGAAWQNFLAWSVKLNKKYNGIVFKPHFIDRPEFNPPDDGVFMGICESLSHKESPYLLNYIPVEILGSIYERFLGKVIVPKGRGISVDVKPEVRKAGGVYYTPKYIVDYIVANTVGKVLRDGSDQGVIASRSEAKAKQSPKDKQTATIQGIAASPSSPSSKKAPRNDTKEEGLNPKEVAKLRFADIACGSGSFLIAIFDVINTYLEEWYNKNPKQAKKDGCKKAAGDRWVLSLSQKRDILKNNIYGVDIDSQAVEVAQLSLFLKLLETESISSTETYQTELVQVADKTILPDLSKNILCGNSLVGYDIADLFPISEADEARIKPFDFETSFTEIMRKGGFDAIVGNPPYRSLLLGKRQKSEEENLVKYYKLHFPNSATYKLNLFGLFTERSISLLNKTGYFSYIVPGLINTSHYFSNLRKLMLVEGIPAEIFDLRYKVFDQAEIGGNGIFIFRKIQDRKQSSINVKIANDFKEFFDPQNYTVSKEDVLLRDGYVLLSDSSLDLIMKRISSINTISLGDLCVIYQGIITGDNKRFLSDKQIAKNWKKILRGRDIEKYSLEFGGTYVNYDPSKLWSNTNSEMFQVKEKIISRQTSDKLIATIDTSGYYTLDSTHVIHLKKKNSALKFLLAIYNSRLLQYLYSNKVKESGRVFAQVKVVNIKPLPIPYLDLTNPSDKSRHDELVKLVDQMMEAKKRLAAAFMDPERERIENKCDYLDRKIDELVYELYGLTEEEIRIVEGR